MAHHAYFLAGDIEQNIERSLAFSKETLGLDPVANSNVTVLRHPSFTVADARRLIDMASQAPTEGNQRVLIIAASRLFHEAQNAMLKLFEEPIEGMTLILLVPSEGVLLPTLRSRLISLPFTESNREVRIPDFLMLSEDERQKFIEKLLDRSKSEKDEEKQNARKEALELLQNLTIYFHGVKSEKDEGKMKQSLLKDLLTFTTILHERSAPLKLIFEHLRIVLPSAETFPKAKV